MVMNVKMVKKTCERCGKEFEWTPPKQDEFRFSEEMGYEPWCDECCRDPRFSQEEIDELFQTTENIKQKLFGIE